MMLPLIQGLTALSFVSLASASRGNLKRTTVTSTGKTHDFQVAPPVLTPSANGRGESEYGCVVTKTLMDYDFANSYGSPYVGELQEFAKLRLPTG